MVKSSREGDLRLVHVFHVGTQGVAYCVFDAKKHCQERNGGLYLTL